MRKISISIVAFLLTLSSGAYSDVIKEKETYVPEWNISVIEVDHGPKNSDAILIDVYLKNKKGDKKLISTNLVGPIILFPKARRIFSCESNAIMGNQGPKLINLNGDIIAKLEHSGFQRDCRRIDDSDLVLLHYNNVKEKKPYNIVRIYNSTSKKILERKLYEATKLKFDYNGKEYIIEIRAPEWLG